MKDTNLSTTTNHKPGKRAMRAAWALHDKMQTNEPFEIEDAARIIESEMGERELAKAVFQWWKTAQFETIPGEGEEEYNLFDEKPLFVQLAEKALRVGEGK